EDGIRDGHVTGVQTCALPIWRWTSRRRRFWRSPREGLTGMRRTDPGQAALAVARGWPRTTALSHAPSRVRHLRTHRHTHPRTARSEERRVGKEAETREHAAE